MGRMKTKRASKAETTHKVSSSLRVFRNNHGADNSPVAHAFTACLEVGGGKKKSRTCAYGGNPRYAIANVLVDAASKIKKRGGAYASYSRRKEK